MRWLKITYALTRTGVPALLSVTVLGACAQGKLRLPGPDAGDARADVGTIILPLRFDAGDAVSKPDLAFPVLPDADSALPALECTDIDGGAGGGLVVVDNRAARLSMAWGPADASPPYTGKVTVGHILVAPQLKDTVVGLPSVTLVSKAPDDASEPTISNMRSYADGFTFDASWAPETPAEQCMYGIRARWTFRTTLRLRCGEEDRAVAAETTLRLCVDGTWTTTDDDCHECATICEMAPSPIVASGDGDELPLAAALDVVVRPRLRIGHDLVLVAEHAPKDGLAYAWAASAGSIEPLADDVALWRVPAETAGHPLLAQVAVTGKDVAAVASLRWSVQPA